MALFFFHVQHGDLIRDEDGTELPDEAAARNVALKIVCEILSGAAGDLWRTGALRLSAEDERRQLLFTLELTACQATPIH